MDKTQIPVTSPRIDYSFILSFYGLLLIVTISNIFSYISDDVLLIIGVSLPLGNSIATFCISLAVFYTPSVHLSEDFLNLFFYLSTGLSVIFADSHVLSLFYSPGPDPYLPSMLSLIFLSLLGPKKLVKDKTLYLSTSFFLATLSFLLNIFASQDRGLTIFQYVILTICIGFSSQKCRSKGFAFSRSVFLAYKELNKTQATNTPLEEVLDTIQKTSEKIVELCNIADQEIKEKAKIILEELKEVFHVLATTKNIYEADLQNIGKDMDIEDKKFIEQNFLAQEESVARNSHTLRLNNDIVEGMYGADKLTGILKQIGVEWNFDIFFVKDLSGNQAIRVCGEYMVKKFSIVSTLQLKQEQLNDYLDELESRYFQNPYHNNTHGADVMCSFMYLLTTSSIIEKLTTIELFATILACLAHDVSHKAKNNRFLIMTQDSLAVQYNDVSVLEMMHASTVFSLLQTEKFNFLPSKGIESFSWFRKIVIETILATDMAKYFDHLAHFKSKYLNEAYSLENPDTRLDFFKVLIKCSDVGHSAKKIELHERWCGLIMEEFFNQGDLEKSLNLTISMFCDRENTNIPKSQAGFIRNIVLPVFNILYSVTESEKLMVSCVKQLESNADYWELKIANKNQTEGFESDRNLLVVKVQMFNPRRGSMPLLFA